MESKIAQKTKEGMQNCTISKKIEGKSTIEHKVEMQNQKEKKKMGCKVAQKKKTECKIAQLANDRRKVQLNLIFIQPFLNNF